MFSSKPAGFSLTKPVRGFSSVFSSTASSTGEVLSRVRESTVQKRFRVSAVQVSIFDALSVQLELFKTSRKRFEASENNQAADPSKILLNSSSGGVAQTTPPPVRERGFFVRELKKRPFLVFWQKLTNVNDGCLFSSCSVSTTATNSHN